MSAAYRTTTIATVALAIVFADLMIRGAVVQLAPERVTYLHGAMPWWGVPFIAGSGWLLAYVSLNRTMLFGTAFLVGGMTTLVVEDVLFGAHARYIQRPWGGEDPIALSEACLYLGLGLLGVSAVLVVAAGVRAEWARKPEEQEPPRRVDPPKPPPLWFQPDREG